MTFPYFYFRPMLGTEIGWSAFNWQSGPSEATESMDFVRCFADSAVESLANLLPMIVNVDQNWLEQPAFIEKFDANQVVIVFPATTLESPQALERCQQLQAQGYHLGVHVNVPGIVKRVPLAGFDYLQFSAAFARNELPAAELSYCADAGFRKIASKVTSREMFDWLSENGFDLHDCGFLTERDPHSSKAPDLTRLKILKLLSLVEKDGNTQEIEAIFREEPKLSYNLLRLVNSVAVGARTRISSFSQAIAILGRRQLQRWLQLLIYANNLADGNAPNPLMQIAAARGRLLELLSVAVVPQPDISELSDKAFMTGLFSLLDVLIHLPMNQILKELPLHDEVAKALLSPAHGGILGELLFAITSGESGDFSSAGAILSKFGITSETHAKAQISAYYWAARINDNNQVD
jgi:EAL and modified HD-GYP domain-containing signal transduction protein